MNEAAIWRNLVTEIVGFHLSHSEFKLIARSSFRREQGDFFNTFLMIFEGPHLRNGLPYLSVLPCIGIGSTRIQELVAELSRKKFYTNAFAVGGAISKFTSENKYKEYHIHNNDDANLLSYFLIKTIDNAFLPLCEKINSVDALYDFINDESNSRSFATVDYVWQSCAILLYKREFEKARLFLLKYAEDIGAEKTTAALQLIDRMASQR